MAEFQFRPLPPGDEVELSFSPSDPAYEFDGQRKHFAAFSIPDGFTPTAMQVKTFLSGGYLPSATAVVPAFIYLDSEFRPIQRSPTTGLQSVGGFWRAGLAGRAAVHPRARYVVVIAGDGIAGGLPVVYSENRTPYVIPAAALGDFSLRLFGEQARK
jgi:hypothetical protein